MSTASVAITTAPKRTPRANRGNRTSPKKAPAKRKTTSKPKHTPAKRCIFPLKLYDMLEMCHAEGLDHIVSWSPNGTGCLIRDAPAFGDLILTRFFGYPKVRSFHRQLSYWGFERELKPGPNQGAYTHPGFLKGTRSLVARRVKRVPNKGNMARVGITTADLEDDGVANVSPEKARKPRKTRGKKLKISISPNLITKSHGVANVSPEKARKTSEMETVSMSPRHITKKYPAALPMDTSTINQPSSLSQRIPDLPHDLFDSFLMEPHTDVPCGRAPPGVAEQFSVAQIVQQASELIRTDSPTSVSNNDFFYEQKAREEINDLYQEDHIFFRCHEDTPAPPSKAVARVSIGFHNDDIAPPPPLAEHTSLGDMSFGLYEPLPMEEPPRFQRMASLPTAEDDIVDTDGFNFEGVPLFRV